MPTADGDDVVGFERVHLEEDAAKTIHEGGGGGRLAGSHGAVVDFNRCGTPLMEMVTRPDLRSPEQASRFASFLRETIVALGVSECDMEKGSLRVDANVSLRRPGEDELRTKTELKNMNSFSYLERGIARELRRQAELYEAGEEFSTQTLHYDPSSDELTVLRSKELAHDYRYFPEPDLVPIEPSAELDRRACAQRCPSCPRRACGASRASTRCRSPQALDLGIGSGLAAYFEEVAAASGDARGGGQLGAQRVLRASQRDARERGRVARAARRAGGADRPRGRRHARLGRRQAGLRRRSSRARAGETRPRSWRRAGSARSPMPARSPPSWPRSSPAHPQQAEQFRAGKENLMGFFVGQVMKATGGRAEPQLAQRLLREEIARA